MIPSVYKEIQGFVSKYASHKEVIEMLYLRLSLVHLIE